MRNVVNDFAVRSRSRCGAINISNDEMLLHGLEFVHHFPLFRSLQ
ncbi:hypothetical protein CAter282_4290 [Collimonas arenae]|uniref:Uncharacterized protein n=2 Tax=Collimonas TaxID=202907 RepID=A0A127QPB7_9BURK|nr:hypothetical protein CAter10_4665 [Collimonas arenae]AMP11950.1 hypothetical protein CAter282_4290 [Collimonas arenae]AMP17204.1 hypothetical protein CPter291_4991 [Collimonas pratensis]